mgnify:CR=1 FL=1
MLIQLYITNLINIIIFSVSGIVKTDGPFNIHFGELVSFKNSNINLFGINFKYLSIKKQQLKIFIVFYSFIINNMLFNLKNLFIYLL